MVIVSLHNNWSWLGGEALLVNGKMIRGCWGWRMGDVDRRRWWTLVHNICGSGQESMRARRESSGIDRWFSGYIACLFWEYLRCCQSWWPMACGTAPRLSSRNIRIPWTLFLVENRCWKASDKYRRESVRLWQHKDQGQVFLPPTSSPRPFQRNV